MNKKGYTLIEVIVSIMILSIASITLAGTFTSVIHFMSKSNNVKNASDSMYETIESNKNDIANVTIKSNKKIDYKIHGTEDILVQGDMMEYSSSITDEISLKAIQNKNDKLPRLKENETYYQKLMNDVKRLIEEKDKLEVSNKAVCDNSGNNACVLDKLNIGENQEFYNEFPQRLLPNALKGTKYYIRLYYPWEKKNNGTVPHQGALIYLSKYNKAFMDPDSDGEVETINIVYVYDVGDESEENDKDKIGRWYYNPSSNIKIKSSSKNKLVDYANFSLVGENGNYSMFYYWNTFRSSVLDVKSNWKELNINAVFEEYLTDSESLWK